MTRPTLLTGCLFKRKILYIVVALVFILLSVHVFEAIYHIFGTILLKCDSAEPIDVVYTWVNGSDHRFLNNLDSFLRQSGNGDSSFMRNRFEDKLELKFSLRSLEKFAPWINHVYIVTNGQIPYWLNLDYEKVTIVTHEEIFLDKSHLPTFSSPAIESHIHRIPGLSKRFLYFNDDMLLGKPVYLEDFWSFDSGYKLYFAWPLPMCSDACPWMYVADEQCDQPCNNEACQMDGGDCQQTELEQSTPPQEIVSISVPATKNSTQTLLDLRPNFQKSVNNSGQGLIKRLVQSYNDKVLMNDKIRRNRHKRKQHSLKIGKLLYQNSSYVRVRANKTKDAYSESLQYSNRLFNIRYGFIPRMVPSHTPLLIDKDVIRSLQSKFATEVIQTSSHKIRRGDDLQYTFTYYYYLHQESVQRCIEEIFTEFDTDGSGSWSDREIRLLLTRLYELPLTYSAVDKFESLLLNCSVGRDDSKISTPKYERYADSRLGTISFDLVNKCKALVRKLNERFGRVKKYKTVVIKNAEFTVVAFKMLNSNVSDVVGDLDDIRSEPRKFICLNDNTDHEKVVENEMIKSIIYDFYLTLFPHPSKYELPEEYMNRFLHVDELNTWKMHNFRVKILIYFCMSLLFYIFCFNFFRRKCCQIINKLFC